MISPTIHPRTLPFDRIVNTTYSLFHNNIFRRMATSLELPEPRIDPAHTLQLDHHMQNTIGDTLHNKETTTFRILGQNANGISPRNNFSKWNEILQSTITHDVDVLCLSETNVEWRHHHVSARLEAITKKFFRHSRLTTASSSIKFERMFKPGGTATLITNEWTGRILKCESDPSGLGRWTTAMLTGKQHRKIAIISAYQVCQTSITTCGLITCFSQQWHLLRAQGDVTPSPRERFWTDLTRYIQGLQHNQYKIILIGDFNTTQGSDNNNPLRRLRTSCHLSDAVGHFHDSTNHTSYSRGATIIDYCFISTDLLPCVRHSGYLPLHFFSYSDHRSLYVDFDSSALFGGAPPKIPKPTARFVSSRDTQTTEKFLQRLGKYWETHSIRTRVNRLAKTLERKPLRPSTRRFAMKIDRDRTRGFLLAEKKCHRRDRPPWSRPLHRLSRQFRYWQIFISDLKLRRHSYNALIAIEDELNWRPDYYPTQLQDAKRLLQQTRKALKEIRKDAQDHRSKDLQLQAQEAELSGDTQKARILRRLHKAETTHKAFLKLRQVLKPKNTGGVTKLELPINQPDGTEIFEVTEDPKIIETACLQHNKQHFSQAQGTPFTVPPLSQIESSACGPVSDLILEGRLDELPFNVKSLPEAQQVILEELEQCLPTMPPTMSFEDFKRRFTIWREDTSTSPSGMYLSLYKALIASKTHDGLIDPQILQEGEDIFMDIFILSNVACRFGFAYDRWKEVVNCMINKKHDSFLLNQLRVIHLFEADYNLIIGLIFGRYMIHRMCDSHLFHPSQWGRPNRECEDVLMLKELTYQVAAMSRTDIATFDNDASACYDRIVTRFALLCCRAHGVPEGPCKMTAEVLDNVIHKIKTAYGISEASYTNTPESPIHGVGQGSQDGPSLWGVSSSVAFRGADRLSNGITCVNPCYEIPHRTISHSRKLDGFIDDVTGWFNRMLQELRERYTIFPVADLAAGMQHDATTWQTLLDITGGKLAVAKCLYYLGHWRWVNGAPQFTSASIIGRLIHLNDDSGNIEIPHFDAQEAHLTLGVWKSPSGNLKQQFDHLVAKSKKWTTAMQSAPLTKDEALLSYSRIYIPSLRYGLGTCYFHANELLRIQRPAVNIILPKMGFNRHFPRPIVYGPPCLGALGLPCLIFEQGLQQLQFLGRHLRSPTSPLRSLFQLGVEWFRMLCGYTVCPLSCPHLSTHHVELAPWFRSLQSFLSTIHHSVEIPYLYLPQKLRELDVAIMSLPQEGFSITELVLVNRCRLFLRVTTLSEISTDDGAKIYPEVWRGHPPPNSFSKLLWPRQHRPPPSSWRVWRKFLQQALRPNYYTCYSTNLPLRQPLGRWIANYGSDRHWLWFYSPQDSAFFRYDRLAKSLQGHLVTQSAHRLITDIDPEFCRYRLPTDAVPIDPRISQDTISLPARFQPQPPVAMSDPQISPACPYTEDILPRPTPTAQRIIHIPSRWSDFPQHMPQWEADLLPNDLPSVAATFIRHAQQTHLTIHHCSDGSCQDNYGSFGWAFGPPGSVIFHHSGQALGAPMDSYLAEGYGLLSTCCFWYRVQKFVLRRQAPKFQLRLYCDNESLVRQVHQFINFPDGSFRRSLTPNYDIVFLIACIIRQFPPHMLHLQHVKGHQDSTTPTHQLSWPAQLNVLADRLASEYVFPTQATPTPFFPSAQIHLRDSAHHLVLKRWNYHLRSAYYRQPYLAWLCRQFSWTSTTLDDIDFEGLDRSLKTLPTHIRRFTTKWINQGLAVRRRVHRYDRLIPSTCAACPTVIECDNHFLQCPSEPRRSACAAALETLHHKLSQLHTEPTIHQSVLHLVSIGMGIPSCTPHTPPDHPLRFQDCIGTMAFLKGRWSYSFRTQQERFYRLQHRGPTYTGERWMKTILSTLVEELHNVWQCRNNQTHGADQTLQEQFLRSQLTIRVQAVYNQVPLLLAHDRAAFETLDQNDLLSGPITTIQTWLKMVEPTLQRCLQDATHKLSTNQSDIRDFFEEMPYINSDASDTTFTFDTYDTLATPASADTIAFTPSSISLASHLSSTSLSSESTGTAYSESDPGPPLE